MGDAQLAPKFVERIVAFVRPKLIPRLRKKDYVRLVVAVLAAVSVRYDAGCTQRRMHSPIPQ